MSNDGDSRRGVRGAIIGDQGREGRSHAGIRTRGVHPGDTVSDWRATLHARFAGRAEPVLVGPDGLRSAASLWSGARAWTALFRSGHAAWPVHLVHPDRLLALQVLMATLWDARPLFVSASPRDEPAVGWTVVDGRVRLGPREVGAVARGGWPVAELAVATEAGLAGAGRETHVPAIVQVAAARRTHADLWSLVAADGRGPERAHPILLPAFDPRVLDTPEALLQATLLPLLLADEVHADVPRA